MSRTIYRYEIPVDDQWHALDLTGDVVHVDCRDIYVVELRAIHTDGPASRRGFRAYGTGHPTPDDVEHVGTAIAPGGHLVWHLMELP
ncbi:DUF7352 domain-containing protein [Streptomyces sp. BA2]|uniref:DUF7352 domain-containing protein n=1 Tax=Streptomyces sp. BA2 TaxID=436595 RepID=UPI001325E210|nr:hypothetical protein [Streptomyces sp. BA2]MWA08754.1 hypothetical protein [Streptomyces sp. BA2]